MGLLATAGAISGMGQGLERGLHTLEQGVIQHGLQEDRFNREATVRDAEHTFQSEKLKEQMRHAEMLQQKTQDAAHTEGEATRALHRETEGDRNTIAAGVAEDNRAEAERADKLKARALDIQENAEKAKSGYYEAYRKYLLGGKEGGSKGAKIDLDTRKAGAAFYSARITPLEKQLLDPMTPDEDKDAMRAKIEELSAEGLKILGFSSKKDNSGSDTEIDDPFGGVVTPKKKTSAETPIAPAVRSARVVSAQTPTGSVGPMDALRGGANAVGEGLINSIRPEFTPTPGITIEKRKPKGD